MGGPHLVLAHVGDDDRVAAAQLVQPVQNVLRPQPALLRVVQRELLAPGRDLLQPFGAVALLPMVTTTVHEFAPSTNVPVVAPPTSVPTEQPEAANLVPTEIRPAALTMAEVSPGVPLPRARTPAAERDTPVSAAVVASFELELKTNAPPERTRVKPAVVKLCESCAAPMPSAMFVADAE